MSLVAGVALGSTGHIAAVTVATIAAQQLAGTPAIAGLPGAAVVLGAAVGSVVLSRIMARTGRRRTGLAAGYLTGVVGALGATLAVIGGSFPLLLAGTFLIGFGNSSNQLSRYAAADMYPGSRRASAIGTVVWGATVGAVVGPNLVEPAGKIAEAMGLPQLAGPYLVPVLFVGLAAFLSIALLRPDPFELADDSSKRTADMPDSGPLLEILGRPSVIAALVALVIGQFVMTLIMTMTPLHMDMNHHTLTDIGLVLSGHTFGMFALSPISGRLTDRFGSPAVIFVGSAVLITSGVMSAVAPPDGGVALFVALFLLGWGWNLGFVAGSALLTTSLSIVERTRIQGMADALIWGTAALASIGSGVILTVAGFTTLGLLGAALVLLPVSVLVSRRRQLRTGTSR
ncbi:MAG: transporter [Chloroflexi bacterium]|nr:transporter [Chloroflexota bacterium]